MVGEPALQAPDLGAAALDLVLARAALAQQVARAHEPPDPPDQCVDLAPRMTSHSDSGSAIPFRKPSRQVGYHGSQPSSRLAFAFEAPRMRVMSDTATAPAASRPTHTGTCRGGLAPSACASSGSHVETGAGSSS